MTIRDRRLDNDFSAVTPKAQQENSQMDKLCLITVNNFCDAKDIIKKVKRGSPTVARWVKDPAAAVQATIEA